MKKTYRYIGENVRAARMSKGLTIEQLAELTDISDSFLGVAERGTSGFSVETIVKIARVLNVSTDSLLMENFEHNQPSTKLDTLCTLLKNCNDADLDFLIGYIKLCKSNGIFRRSAF